VDVVLSSRSNVGNFAFLTRGHQDAVLGEETVLVDYSEDISLSDNVSLFELVGLKLPKLFPVESRHIHSLGHKD